MPERLDAYRKKRDFDRTSEPKWHSDAGAEAPRFVVQEHNARRLHWDLRLESDLDDWEVLLALHHNSTQWDGLVPTDSSMVRTPESLAVLMQTKLTLVVAMEAGHDMLKATGLLFAYPPGILGCTNPAIAQVWKLQAANRAHTNPWEELRSVAEHQNLDVEVLWKDARLSPEDLERNPLESSSRRRLSARCAPLARQ